MILILAILCMSITLGLGTGIIVLLRIAAALSKIETAIEDGQVNMRVCSNRRSPQRLYERAIKDPPMHRIHDPSQIREW